MCVLSGAAGAVDEDTFVKGFEDVSKVYVSSRHILISVGKFSPVCTSVYKY